ncbi:helix-turn-helix domain-containing protein [Dyella sp. A6]|uniref:helix-turn-helix domain-containing protein n=1 Tax=Dyella aluminiiresistens TaxID=3069105 RepID=UPI002E78DFB7|nr:RodZ domain-containing protein [Dyella sp. A6]
MQQSIHVPEPQAGFGSRLRAAREARSLGIEACGQALHLPVRVLRQIENDDRSGIDYQVYLAGYLRKYGRHLGIDDAEIDAEIARSKHSPAIQESPALVATGGISHSRYLLDRYARAATYVVLTVVFAVPTIYLGMHGTLNSDMSHLASLDAKPVAQKIVATPSIGAKADKLPAATLSVPAVKPPQVDQPLMASMMPVPNLAGDVAAAAHPAPPVASSIGSGDHSLQLTLGNTSWVEVTDADGQRLEYGLLPAGTVRTYHSSQPLDVRIGNANGAQASIDGQAVSLDDYRHANVAHFRVNIQDGKATPAGA